MPRFGAAELAALIAALLDFCRKDSGGANTVDDEEINAV